MKLNTILGFVAMGFVILASCGKNKNEQDIMSPQDVIEVQLSKPFSDSMLQSSDLIVNGRMESYHASEISSRVMGNVMKVLVREGQTVKKGQLLMQIKSEDLLTQKARLEESSKEAEAGFTLAQKNYNRFKVLHEQSSATDFELDQAKLQLESARSGVGQIKQSIAQVQVLIGEANVKSPFDGTVTAIYAEPGALANPGMPLIKVETSSALILKVQIPESEIQNINKNQEVRIEMQHSGEICIGSIQQINPSSNLSGSQYEMEIKPDAQKVKLLGWKAGMYATAKIKRVNKLHNHQNIQNELLIPKKALIEKGQLYGIYTVSEDQKALLRWVRLGKDYGDRVEILSGLNKNEAFITEADSRLYNGAPVQVK